MWIIISRYHLWQINLLHVGERKTWISLLLPENRTNSLNVLVQTDSLLAETPSYYATCIVLGLIATLLLLFALICPGACQISLVCSLFSDFCSAPEANLRETVLLKVFWNHSWNMMHNLLRLKQWQNLNVIPLNWFLVYKKVLQLST